jgi:acetyltransferase
MAEELNFAFYKFVSFGNRCDVGEIDLIEYFENDHKPKLLLALYIEGLLEGRKFLLQAGKTSLKKTDCYN